MTRALSRRLPGLFVLLLFVPLLVPLAKSVRDGQILLGNPQYRYADGTAPLLTSHDGYYFLRLAMEDTPASCCRPAGPGQPHQPVPTLSQVDNVAARLLGISPKVAAFYLPPILAALLPLAVFAWGRLFYGDAASLAAALAAAICPYFCDVTALGQYDTDGLVPTLFLLSALALHQAVTTGGLARLRAVAAFGLLAVLSLWWWKPGFSLCLALLPIGACILLSAKGRLGRLAWAAGLGSIGLLGFFLAGGAYQALPAPLAELFGYATRHAALVLGLTPGTAAVARSVIELRPPGLVGLGEWSTGHAAVLAVACLGIVRLFRLRPTAAACLLPLLLAGALGWRSQRLVLLFFPLASLGLGAVVDWLLGRPSLARLTGEPARAGVALLLTAGLLVPAFFHAARTVPTPPFDRNDDRLALAVAEATPLETVLWTWWDYGYFFQLRAARPVFFDGGSQTAEDCFAAAWPLAAADADMAADWIRYFAAHGPGELGRLAARFGSRGRAVDFLLELFGRPAERDRLLASLPGEPLADPWGHFFPTKPVCLVLPLDFLDKSGFWLAYAAGPEVSIALSPGNHVDVFAKEGFEVDPAAGRLVLPNAARAKGYGPIPTVWDADGAPPTPESLAGRADPILFYSRRSPLVAIADLSAAKSLAFKLLVLPGFSHPRFRPIWHEPKTGGAWLIEPSPPHPTENGQEESDR